MQLLAALGGLLTISVISFLAVRQYAGPTAVVAQEPNGTATALPDGRDPFWYVEVEQAEKARPRFIGQIGAIPVSPTEEEVDACGDLRGPGARAAGTTLEDAASREPGLDPRPHELPAGTALVPGEGAYGIDCEGEIVFTATAFEFGVSADSSYGGWLNVFRQRGAATARLDVAADRVSKVVVGSRPALLVEPLSKDGFGSSYVVIDEPWGMTYIESFGLTAEQLLAVADSLPSEEQ